MVYLGRRSVFRRTIPPAAWSYHTSCMVGHGSAGAMDSRDGTCDSSEEGRLWGEPFFESVHPNPRIHSVFREIPS